MENQKWHEKPVVVVLLLIFFFPLGLYFMWKNKIWSNKARIGITVVIALLVITQIKTPRNNQSTSATGENEAELSYVMEFNSIDFMKGYWTLGDHPDIIGKKIKVTMPVNKLNDTYCKVKWEPALNLASEAKTDKDVRYQLYAYFNKSSKEEICKAGGPQKFNTITFVGTYTEVESKKTASMGQYGTIRDFSGIIKDCQVIDIN